MNDLREVVKKLMITGKEQKMEGMSALYGVTQTISDMSLAHELGCRYLDVLYETEHPST